MIEEIKEIRKHLLARTQLLIKTMSISLSKIQDLLNIIQAISSNSVGDISVTIHFNSLNLFFTVIYSCVSYFLNRVVCCY